MLVGIVGLGYVGLPLAVAFAEAGVDVCGVDIDEGKLASLAANRSYVEDVSDASLAAVRGRLGTSGDYAPLARADAILVCVPTPLSANREPDLRPLLDSARELERVLRAGQLVVLESTTYPGTTRERL